MAKFPQPRLETNEPMEINDFRVQEEKTLNSYGWVDQQAGVVRIPIARAMELLVQRGLPTRPQAGRLPPSDVNTAREADAAVSISSQPARGKNETDVERCELQYAEPEKHERSSVHQRLVFGSFCGEYQAEPRG